MLEHLAGSCLSGSWWKVGLEFLKNLVCTSWEPSSWTEDESDSGIVELLVVLWWDDTSSDHKNVSGKN